MNDAGYAAAYAAWQRSIPFSEPGAYRAARARLIETAAPEHVPTVEEVSYMSDQCTCSCGWKSNKFFDGAEYAEGEWRDHVYAVITDELETP